MSQAIQVVTTTSSQEDAQTIANKLVRQNLAACVQISGPVMSVYRWQGKVESSEEWRCTIKTCMDLYPQVESAISDLHTYDVPEILATEVATGSPTYLKWLEEQVHPSA